MPGRPARRDAAELLPAGHAFHRGSLLASEMLAWLGRSTAALHATRGANGSDSQISCPSYMTGKWPACHCPPGLMGEKCDQVIVK